MKMESVISIDFLEQAIQKESDEQVRGVMIVARNQLMKHQNII